MININKILFGVSLTGLLFSIILTVVSIWNNHDWLLLERGYYTFGVLTVAVTVYLVIQLSLDFNDADSVHKLNTAVAVAFAIVSAVFMAISIRNTEWVLLEKGYYWMGLAFVIVTSAMVSATIRTLVSQPSED